MRILYRIGIYVYLLSIRLASLGNLKAKKWIRGRKDLFKDLEQASKKLQNPVWFHCASLGEFEQGRPLIEAIKRKNPSVNIVLSFFSSSGFEVQRKYEYADYVCYIPLDTPANAKRFLEILNPSAIYFVKYEFWFNFLEEIARRKVPAFLVSGVFRKDQLFFKSYGGWFRKKLYAFKKFYVQDSVSEKLLKDLGFSNILVSGDTRFDRVREIAANPQKLPLLEAFCKNKFVLIAGSSWEPEEALLATIDWKSYGYKLIIAPHETNQEHVSNIFTAFSKRAKVGLYSVCNAQNISEVDVLIIDCIGILSSVYHFGSIALIGGGFGEGIHNILEPAVAGLPVLFGPNYEKFNEAVELIEKGGAFCIRNSKEFGELFAKLSKDRQALKVASDSAAGFVKERSGAVRKIIYDLRIMI